VTAHSSQLLLAGAVRRHALGWLVAANAVGVWLALTLLWPGLGDALAPWSYGRWMPLHLDWQLYGWCALPLVGVILRHCLPPDGRGVAPARGALGLWSAALAVGGLEWLGGYSSGKLFLDWTGAPKAFFAFALAALWLVLVREVWRAHALGAMRGGALAARVVLLALLAAVPGVLYWSAGRNVYPAVNPDSGGATGASLLGSTLGIIALFGLLPAWLGLGAGRGGARGFWAAFGASALVYAVIRHGHASHHEAGQILGLAVLLTWVPLLARHLARYAWQPESRLWLRAAFAWWGLLVLQGFLIFLPGLSERLKFTHGLVSHAHLAMAGLLTAMNFVMLHELAPAPADRRAFWLWQAGCLLQVGLLFALGWGEAADPTGVFLGGPGTQAVYLARAGAGVLMLAASVRWLRAAWRETEATA